jgi:acetolactate synthase-1/2/3 large subunit
VIEAVWEHLPDAILVADVTEPARYGRIAAAPPAPRRWWTAECGFRALGYALPAAIGAKVAEPRRPVVALIGDGGIAGVVGELSAAFEAAAHVIVLVWNNSGYGETREQMRAAGVKPVGVDLAPVEFQPLARAFGAAHARVHNAGYLRDALKKAMMRPGPTILELREEYWFEA